MKEQTKDPFITLYIPRKKWFHKLLEKQIKREDISLSGQLIQLVLEDLEAKGLLTKAEIDDSKNITTMKTKKFSRTQYKTFMLYIPASLSWIPERISKVSKSRSFYIWNLLVKKHYQTLSVSAKTEWGDPESAQPPAVGKKKEVEKTIRRSA